MPDLYLGIDTSNYKTSIAVTDSDNRTVFERSEYLEVPQGSRGLRQSEAFFRHSNRLPSYIDDMCKAIDVRDLAAAGVSTRPRRVEGSYMPCFLAGINAAREITSVLGIPLHEFSHQEGHAAAIIENTASCEYRRKAALFHLSGGTTEFLICEPDDMGYHTDIFGGTLDISLGQLIDRAGVAMGYPFPAGAYLDELAGSFYSANGRARSLLPRVRITDGKFNLSGTETRILRLIEDSSSAEDHPAFAYSIFETAASLLAESAVQAGILLSDSSCGSDTARPRVYMAGGVSASSYIRRSIRDKLAGRIDAPEVIFGDPALSGDNAVGTARLARRINSSK